MFVTREAAMWPSSKNSNIRPTWRHGKGSVWLTAMLSLFTGLPILAGASPADEMGVRNLSKDTSTQVPAPGPLPLAYAPLPFPDPTRANSFGQRGVLGLVVEGNPSEAIPAVVRLELDGFAPVSDSILCNLGLVRATSGTFVSLDGEPTASVLTARHVTDNLRDGLPPDAPFDALGFPGTLTASVTDWRVNAVVDTLLSSVKQEQGQWKHYQTRYDAQQDILEYITMFDNSQRLHSYLDYMSPCNYEQQLLEMKNAA